MKNILLFLSILLFAACSKKTEIVPEVVPDPTLNLTLSADSVHSGESVVVTCFTENAVRTSNNFGAPITTQWTYTLNPTQTTTLEVTAYNKLEKSIKKTKKVTFVQWTKKDTMTNYLCSSPYKATKRENEYVAGIWEEQSMTPLESRELWLFDKNGTSRVWDPVDGRTIANHLWHFTEDLTSLYAGGRTDSIGLLDNKTLVLVYWVYSYNPQTGQYDIKAYRGRKTYTHQ